jgi:ATP-dependent helicase/nuclease subunit A
MELKQQQQKISQKATKLQLQASNPTSSVWVSASAGTGKTHVLTQRILRLLLSDQNLKISEVLAITFTKAAAMEMQNRLIEKLASWLQMSDFALMDELEELLQRKPTAKDLTYARTLLTKVIDDSIGLNISTVHSFCETLLRKFPLEANIPSSFTLIEERDSKRLLKKAWYKSLKKQIDVNKSLFYEVINLLGEHSLTEAVNNVLSNQNRFYKMLQHAGGINSFIENLKAEFKVTSFDEDKLYNQIIDFDLTTKDNLKELMHAGFAANKGNGLTTAETLDIILAKHLTNKELVESYISVFATKAGTVKSVKSILAKNYVEGLSFDLELLKQEEFDRINNILDQITNLQNYKISQVICILADQMFKYYKQEKLDLSYLDFNDLIDYAEKLVNKSEIQDWIRYKLDSKIKHCLIDEAQDTDMQQWNILHGIIQEFYFGEGQHEKPRTTFAVGDMKQSIYRFRGANPEVFTNIKEKLDISSNHINHDFEVVDLHTSFRSTQAVLNFVDEVFNEPVRKQALDGNTESLHHQVYKYDQEGRVEIAKILTKDDLEEQEKDDAYSIPKEEQESIKTTSLRQLNYANVARKIKNMLDMGENEPKDIIILQRNRTGMPELIEELTKLNIPHTGADEIYLSNSVIIDDLMAFAKFLCFENDDLSLLHILKSPAFNFKDEVLFKFFAEYKKQNKIKTFYQYIKNIQEFDYVVSKLNPLIYKANNIKVFNLFLEIINSLDLTEKLMANLGGSIKAQQNQVKDTIDEFLRQIQNYNQISLLAFLDWFKKYSAKIKKNTANAKDAVRLMTIHGSKGLEANAIFLPDCGNDSVIKGGVNKEKLLFKKDLTTNIDKAFIYKTRSTAKITQLEQEIVEEQTKLFFEDDMRLLYVALTRARGEIYISGIQENNELSEYSWYSILHNVMNYRVNCKSVGYSQLADGTLVFKSPKLLENDKKAIQEIEKEEIVLPDWVNKDSIKENSIVQERASYNITSLEYIDNLKQDFKEGYKYGNLVHKLLEELPKINKSEHENYINNFIKDDNDEIKVQVLKVLDKYSELFNEENSLAEVPVQGMYGNKKITGFVDRIVEFEDKIYVIDYKTGKKNAAYMQKYKQQLDIYCKVLKNVYPHKMVIPAILWVSSAELETL